MIHARMWDKAQALIAADALAEYRRANVLPNGRKRKQHRPYSVTPRAEVMVKALGSGDADLVGSLIVTWRDLLHP